MKLSLSKSCCQRLSILGLSVLFSAQAHAASASIGFTVLDNIGWRAGKTSVTAATETYTYDPAADKLTVTTVFNASDLAPLPPMLALATTYQFPIQVQGNLTDTGSKSIFGPLLGIASTNTITYTMTGLGKYVLDRPALGSGSVPAELQAELDAKVSDVLSQGHLAPWIYLKNNPGGANNGFGELYWNDPGEILTYLAEIYPLVPAEQASLSAYMGNERSTYPPENLRSVPLADANGVRIGVSRSVSPTPDDYYAAYQNGTIVNNIDSNFTWRCQGPPRIWNVYGLARYYEITGQVPSAQVMAAANQIVQNNLAGRDWPTLYWTENNSPHYNAVHGVNQTFAGLIGYIRLARLAGDTQAEALGWGLFGRMAALRFAMGKYTQYQYAAGYFTLPPDPAWWAKLRATADWQGEPITWNWTRPIDNVRQVHWLDDKHVAVWEFCHNGQNHINWITGNGQKMAGDDIWWNPPSGDLSDRTPYLLPFADMVPELGRFLGDYLKPEVSAYCDRMAENNPHWYAANGRGFLLCELMSMVPQDSYTLFLAHAWSMKDSASQLAQYIDVSPLKVGDFFYMHKLAETIKAYRGVTWQSATGSTRVPAAPKGLRKR